MNNPVKILVIDDEIVGRQLLEAILTPEDYDVLFGEDGKQGLDLALSEIPDIILCDVMMPGLDGFEVCKKLRSNSITQHIPIFLITALDDRDSRIKGIDAGADDYISKPFDRVEIMGKIKNRLTRLNKGKFEPRTPEKVIKQKTDADTRLIEGLIEALSGGSENNQKLDLYRSAKKSESNHIFSQFRCNNKFYYFLVSNNLKLTNAPLVNCCLLSILHHHSAQKGNINPDLMTEVVVRFEEIMDKAQIKNISSSTISIAAVMGIAEESSILCTGMNQTVLINRLKNEQSPDIQPNYQRHPLTSSKDIYLNRSDSILLLSPNIANQVDPARINSFLTREKEKAGDNQLARKIPAEFNLTKDVLIAILTF